MTTFALIASILSLIGLLICATALLSVLRSLGSLKASLEKLDASVSKLDSAVSEQKRALSALEAKVAAPRALPATASFADSVVQGLVGAVGANRIPPVLSPVLSYAVRQIVGYLGKRVNVRKRTQ